MYVATSVQFWQAVKYGCRISCDRNKGAAQPNHQPEAQDRDCEQIAEEPEAQPVRSTSWRTFACESFTVVGLSQKRSRPVILLVEDDPSMMDLLREVCRMQNYDPREAWDGKSALQLAAAAQPDLVLLDWELPDISGIEVCQDLRRSGLMVPILMLTGRSDDRDVVAGLEHGVDEYLIKPIRPRVLAARVAANLRRSLTSSEAVDADIPSRVALLGRVSIFLGHPSGALRELARRSTPVYVKTGTSLLTQGDPNNFLFVIQTGSFQVAVTKAPEKRLSVALLAESDFFGAVSVLTGEPALATVTAREESTVVKIARDDFLAALMGGPHFRAEFERVVAQRRDIVKDAHRRVTAATDNQLITFYSPKGGVGKTTLTLNLAATVARHYPGEVLLFDLSLPYNHAAMLAQLAPTSSLARLAEAEGDFEQRLESALTYHRAGFFLLSTALAPEESDLITPALVARAMAVLQPQFRFVLIDLGIVLTEVALSLLEQSQHVFIVASPELLIVKDLISFYGVLRGVLKLHEGQIHLVINHRAKTATVPGREMEKLLGVSVALEVRHDGRRPDDAALRGEILALSSPRSPIAKAAGTLARIFTRNHSGK